MTFINMATFIDIPIKHIHYCSQLFILYNCIYYIFVVVDLVYRSRSICHVQQHIDVDAPLNCKFCLFRVMLKLLPPPLLLLVCLIEFVLYSIGSLLFSLYGFVSNYF